MSTPSLILTNCVVMVLRNVFINENLKNVRSKIFVLFKAGLLVLHLNEV